MRTLQFVFALGLMSACARAEASRQSVQVDMQNVDLHLSADVTLHVNELRGRFVGAGREVPYLDDKNSYTLAVDSGEVSLDLSSLNALLARTFGGDNSNVDKTPVHDWRRRHTPAERRY